MNARRRTKTEITEPNVYESGGYYRYKHPQTKKFHPLGTDLEKALIAARKLNAILIPKQTDLVAKVLAAEAKTIPQVIESYRTEWLINKNMKESTLEIVEYQLGRFEKDLANKLITDLTTRFIADYLNEHFERNAYIKHRVRLIDICNYAVSRGWIEINPAEPTQAKSNVVKDRLPLNIEQYKIIHPICPPWLQNAMDLSLTTLQANNEIVSAQYSHLVDGHWQVIRQKTKDKTHKAYIAIEITDQMQGIIKATKRNILECGACPYIIHEKPKRRNKSKSKTHWAQVIPDRLSKQFSYYRDQTGLFDHLPMRKRPTFHEIRSLGGHLYLDQGYSKEFVNLLMGHTTMEMTEDYTDRHKRWQQVGGGELVINE